MIDWIRDKCINRGFHLNSTWCINYHKIDQYTPLFDLFTPYTAHISNIITWKQTNVLIIWINIVSIFNHPLLLSTPVVHVSCQQFLWWLGVNISEFSVNLPKFSHPPFPGSSFRSKPERRGKRLQKREKSFDSILSIPCPPPSPENLSTGDISGIFFSLLSVFLG